jgi:cytochrome c3-like protein
MTLMSSGYLAAVLTTEAASGTKALLLPGATTAGHYQIELSCASCHTPFGGVANDACLRCHDGELAAADDSHPRSKFTDPRNAALVVKLDATRCATCHKEHAPAMTRAMGVTLPDDYCQICHANVGQDRPSHAGMTFDTCASAGCHNYHDNTALYEDFLVAHAGEPAVLPTPRVPAPPAAAKGGGEARRLAALPSDAPAHIAVDPNRLRAWEATSHARAGVNCMGCHTGRRAGEWLDRPGETQCATCHDTEVQGFFGGRHGMRVAAEMPRMTPAEARLPMRPEAHARTLSCVSCHADHDFDTRRAAVDACLGCHADRHSRAYVGSPHHERWTNEQTSTTAAGTGVSCATCHLPRIVGRVDGADVVTVQHNQNANLRPNEKMARTACMHCHGLGFSLDALADPGLVASNFRGTPLRHVAGIAMAMTRSNRHAN